MTRLLFGIVTAVMLLALPAYADVACSAVVPEGPVAVGDPVLLGGEGFDPGTPVAVYVGASNVAGGTADASGTMMATWVFDTPGEHPVQAFGFVDGEHCALGYLNLQVEGDGESAPVVTVPTGFVPPLLTTTTTPVIGQLGFLDGWTVVVEGEAVATPDSAETTAGPTTTSVGTTVAAAPAVESDDGTSIVLLGVVTAFVAALLGLGAGWVFRRRRT